MPQLLDLLPLFFFKPYLRCCSGIISGALGDAAQKLQPSVPPAARARRGFLTWLRGGFGARRRLELSRRIRDNTIS